ncbi:MAG: NUDIX hydrolase [Spirochaetes bacterium]|nr:MAG: NUDIX hydrolase [Spirochaetota bacterium]
MSSEKDDTHLRWENLESETQYDAGIFRLRTVRRRSPDGKKAPFVSVDAPDWVTIIPELEGGDKSEFLMVRQYRHGSEMVEMEFPAGVIDPGEKPAEAAARELLEETGYKAKELREIGSVSPNPAFMTNRTYTYIARGLEKKSEQNLDEHEILDVHTVKYDDLKGNLGIKPYDNAITLQAWFFYLRESGRLGDN